MSRRFLIVFWISTWGFGQSIIKYSAVSCHQDSWRRDSRCPPPSAMHIVTTSMHSRTTVKVNILDTHSYIKKVPERIRIHRKTKDLKRVKREEPQLTYDVVGVHEAAAVGLRHGVRQRVQRAHGGGRGHAPPHQRRHRVAVLAARHHLRDACQTIFTSLSYWFHWSMLCYSDILPRVDWNKQKKHKQNAQQYKYSYT